MKSPDALRERLRRQWYNAELRQRRLLEPGQWPLELSIGKPTPAAMLSDLAAVREHVERWRGPLPGEVVWRSVSYRSTAEAVKLPLSWRLHSVDEWIAAVADAAIRLEYRLLSEVLGKVDPQFHRLLVRQRQQWLSHGADEVIRAGAVALELAPGCAAGRPLRALSVAGSDSKFFERNRSLLSRLLEQRFGPQVLELGLESFLGAPQESEHWLLVAPLEAGLLPFDQQRVRSSELARTPLPGSHLLIVENERSLYQLGPLAGTLAILGAGLNLSWMHAPWLAGKAVAYWGDIDTWGLSMLAAARTCQPALTPLLMDPATFEEYAEAYAVAEPVTAGAEVPGRLTEAEAGLYRRLCREQRGRLEQEFIPRARVAGAVKRWRGD